MGIRTYMVVTQRVQYVKAPNKTVVKQKIESGEVPIYEDETITVIKERLPKHDLMDVDPAVYTPKNVLKRKKAEEKTETVAETAPPTAEDVPTQNPKVISLEERRTNNG